MLDEKDDADEDVMHVSRMVKWILILNVREDDGHDHVHVLDHGHCIRESFLHSHND